MNFRPDPVCLLLLAENNKSNIILMKYNIPTLQYYLYIVFLYDMILCMNQFIYLKFTKLNLSKSEPFPFNLYSRKNKFKKFLE